MKRKPGIQKAVDYIICGINLGSFSAGEPLPSIKGLADSADVSFVTMWKAVDQLRITGLLETRRGGKRMFVTKKGESQAAKQGSTLHSVRQKQALAGPLWQMIKESIYRDILTGRYPAGAKLPSHKELQSIYNISYPTIKKAVDSLASEGIITAFHRGYTVPSLTASGTHTRIVALGCGWEDGRIWMDYLDKNYFRMLERECINSRVGLDVVVYFHKANDIQFIHSATRRPYDMNSEDILGIVFIVANLEFMPEEVLKKLSYIKKPFAVLDVVGGWSFPERALNNAYFHFCTSTASIRPAIKVAQYLIGLGHKHIAYFSPFHKAFWSQIRLEGITETYRAAGLADAISTFVLPQYRYQWDYLQDREEPEDIELLVKEYNKWKRLASDDFFRRFGNISYSISKYLTEWNCASGEIYHRMVVLFKKALSNKKITAWVMSNDFTATLALDFLKQKGIQIPERISVIAFDDTFDAMEYRLTSYNFNNNGIVSWMLRHIMQPSLFDRSNRKKVFEPEGMIVERQTTGRAP